ncbi:MAG: endopeptidase La [Kiritimatiellae bacterium]|nr:endopeptidase La [Kiritimatiellia bacterium]
MNTRAMGHSSSPPPPGTQSRGTVLPAVPILPLNDVVLFPAMIAPLLINTARSKRLAEFVSAGDRLFAGVLQRQGDLPDDQVGPEQLHDVGCFARVLRMLRFPDDTVRMLVQGERRCRLGPWERTGDPFLRADVMLLDDIVESGPELAALARTASHQFMEVISLSPVLPEELKIALFNTEDPARLSDLIAANLPMPISERQALLAELSVRTRLERILVLLNREREVLQLGRKIQARVSETFSKTQREHVLREQLRQIRAELGETESTVSDIERLRERLREAKLPPEASSAAEAELERLAVLPPASPEYGVARTYLDWLASLPWSVETTDRLDLRAAGRVLSSRHYGLDKVRERILEFLAVLRLKRDLAGPILCFVGPPGVGKTSLGQAIADAMGRRFVRLSLGGLQDEAEIRGHRRTYVGALPGRILQSIRRAGSRNPVFMLDELDKIGRDFRGDPAAALLEVLDPEQNRQFRDHYLDVAFDLSHVLFITTANVLDPVPAALRDRLEVIELPGYTPREKLEIARRHLLPRQIEQHGLRPHQLEVPDEAIDTIIRRYTREAGVRQLDRHLAALCRKAARSIVARPRARFCARAHRLRRWLGPPRIPDAGRDLNPPPGLAQGLAWTPEGGDILTIEVATMHGQGRRILTGLLGDVLKESAETAVSLVRARSEAWDLPADFTEHHDLHIHVPAGAVPKDGPSAGLAIAVALVSLLRRQPVPSDCAMTGEITLRGRVLPVGGIREKVLAAARGGIRRVILPAANRDDLAEVPLEVRRQLQLIRVRDVDAALAVIFGDDS